MRLLALYLLHSFVFRECRVHRVIEIALDVSLAPLLLFSILREAFGESQFAVAYDDAARREGRP